MTCHHKPGDPACSSTQSDYGYSSSSYNTTPDASNFTIMDAERVGTCLILKVKYPNCSSCAYEGTKVMVFAKVGEFEALKWKKIDPHFRGPSHTANEAPSPIARFPGTSEGWNDAKAYARGKTQ